MKEKIYRQTKFPINSRLTVVQDNNYKWGVIDEEGKTVVPFGKYAWIDGFQNGLAKVIGYNDTTSKFHICTLNIETAEIDNSKHAEQGIINELGEEVLPLEYVVWKFYEKEFRSIKAFKDNKEYNIDYEQLLVTKKAKNGLIIDSSDTDISEEDEEEWRPYSDDNDTDWRRDTWDAMTDGQYGDMPEGFDGDFDFLGY